MSSDTIPEFTEEHMPWCQRSKETFEIAEAVASGKNEDYSMKKLSARGYPECVVLIVKLERVQINRKYL